MKQYIILFIIFLFMMNFPHHLFAEDEEVIVISEEVGEVIDAEERERFGLWPEIVGYRSVRFLKLDDGSYVAEVKYIEDGVERMDRTPQSEYSIQSLRNYIEKVSEEEIELLTVEKEGEGGKGTFKTYRKGEKIILSEKIGESIDKDESNSHLLFTNIPEFESATFYSIEEGGVLIEIQTSDDLLASVVMEEKTGEILKDYFDRYEEIQGNKEQFEEKWSILSYDEQGIPITKTEVLNFYRVVGLSCGCALGCGALGFLGGGVVSTVFAIADMSSDLNATPMVIGTAVGTVMGYFIGKEFDDRKINRESIINKIKESRIPK